MAYLLNKKDCNKIVTNSRKVLNKAIKMGGSSIKNFISIKGKMGNFQKNFQVYERNGLSCKRLNCKGVIQKKNISNRSTFFCNLCQV